MLQGATLDIDAELFELPERFERVRHIDDVNIVKYLYGVRIYGVSSAALRIMRVRIVGVKGEEII
jgi:hypothetical protein